MLSTVIFIAFSPFTLPTNSLFVLFNPQIISSPFEVKVIVGIFNKNSLFDESVKLLTLICPSTLVSFVVSIGTPLLSIIPFAKPSSETVTVIGAISLSVIVVSTELFTVLTLTSSNPPTAPKLDGLIATVKFSAPSARLSSIVAIVNVAVFSPALITTLATPVKSVPSTAFPEYVKLTVKSVSGACVILTVYGVVISPSITFAGPVILTIAV